MSLAASSSYLEDPPPFPISTPPPVCQRGTAPSFSSVYPLYLNAFLPGRLLFIPSGGLTVNLLHWGEISGNGARISGYPASAPRSGSLSIHLCISPLICLAEQPPNATRHLSFRPSLPVWSSSQGWIFGQASTSFHFQLQQTERLH